MNEREKSTTNTEAGFPEIAQKFTKKNTLVLVMAGIVLTAVVGLYFHSRSEVKPEKTVEETYTIQPAILPAQHSNEQPNAVAQPTQQVSEEQVALIQEAEKQLQQRLSAPLMVVNNNMADKQESKTASVTAKDPNMQFMNQLSAREAGSATATTIGPLNTLVAEGSLIHATLESATNSDLPGFLRASVSEPVYSEDGTQVLVPVGSRLIGQYKSGLMQGQSRIFIVWTRLIAPTGIAINLGSAGADGLGVAGMGADEINRHFWERFGMASLLSLISAGAANTGVSGLDQQNSAAAYREAMANSFNQSASQSLQQDSMIAPTLKTYQGKPILVFVARDLHFADVLQQAQPKFNVF